MKGYLKCTVWPSVPVCCITVRFHHPQFLSDAVMTKKKNISLIDCTVAWWYQPSSPLCPDTVALDRIPAPGPQPYPPPEHLSCLSPCQCPSRGYLGNKLVMCLGHPRGQSFPPVWTRRCGTQREKETMPSLPCLCLLLGFSLTMLENVKRHLGFDCGRDVTVITNTSFHHSRQYSMWKILKWGFKNELTLSDQCLTAATNKKEMQIGSRTDKGTDALPPAPNFSSY